MKRIPLVVALASPTLASAQTAVIYMDGPFTASDRALTAAGVPYALFDRGLGPQFLAASVTADIVIVETIGALWPPEVRPAVEAAISGGKIVIIHHWAYGYDPESASLFPTLGVASSRYDTYSSDLFSVGSYGFFGLLGGSLLGGADRAVYNNTYFELVPGAGDVAATNAAGEPAIIVVNGGRTIVNGFLPYDWEYTDLNWNGITDGEDVFSAELDFLMNGPGLTLSLSGACPGPVVLDTTGGTPGGPFAVARSDRLGAFAVRSGPCAGTTLAVYSTNIRLVATPSFDGAGEKRATPTLGVCGKYYQIVDLTTCATSPVVMK
jgi:hypothetical protein